MNFNFGFQNLKYFISSDSGILQNLTYLHVFPLKISNWINIKI